MTRQKGHEGTYIVAEVDTSIVRAADTNAGASANTATGLDMVEVVDAFFDSLRVAANPAERILGAAVDVGLFDSSA